MAGRASGRSMECDIVIVAGFGFRSDVSVDALADALIAAQLLCNVQATVFATDIAKAQSEALCCLAKTRGVPVVAVAVAGVATQTQSARVLQLFATGSVAEAAALVAAGPGARLLAARCASGDGAATVALAASVDLAQTCVPAEPCVTAKGDLL
jgi:cobalt-precorrin 5A hydrolase